MGNELVYLDTYILQQDMRIRLPKTILQNMNVEKGEWLNVEKGFQTRYKKKWV